MYLLGSISSKQKVDWAKSYQKARPRKAISGIRTFYCLQRNGFSDYHLEGVLWQFTQSDDAILQLLHCFRRISKKWIHRSSQKLNVKGNNTIFIVAFGVLILLASFSIDVLIVLLISLLRWIKEERGNNVLKSINAIILLLDERGKIKFRKAKKIYFNFRSYKKFLTT